jgi:hypothetical protein
MQKPTRKNPFYVSGCGGMKENFAPNDDGHFIV